MRNVIRVVWVSIALLQASIATAATEPTPSVAEFTQSMEKAEGFFDLYHDTEHGKFYLLVPNTQQSFIFQTSLPWGLGSNDVGLDRGQLGQTQLAHFKVQGNRVLLIAENTQYRAAEKNPAEHASVQQAFADSTLFGFNVVAHHPNGVLIDYTPFLLTDVHGVSERLQQTGQGQFSIDSERSVVYPARTKSFPDNTELEATVTFVGKGEGRYVNEILPNADTMTLHLHHSFIRLPDDKYRPRQFDPNSGFWAQTYYDYSAPLGEPLAQRVIPRHRLAKKDPIASSSEPQQPIIYYLDPGAPEPVKSALLEGAAWWEQAFAAAGYENAFQVKMLPADADPMDVRYNVIQWVHRATRGWSYGSSVIDPRTGEIIKGHVTLGSLRVRQDMKIAEGLIGPFSQQNSEELKESIEQMALARIRQLSAHEVGHTLGIAHNFAASADNRASVMDYPHPLVTLTTAGEISLNDAYDTGIGEWDKQVVAYGYSDFGGMPSEQEQLDRILQKNQSLGLAFISDRDARPVGGAHPTAHLWDNGSDAVTELERLLNVRKQVLADFGQQQLRPDAALSDLQEVFVPIYLMHRYQTEAAVKWLGGVNYRYYMNDEKPNDYGPVSPSTQKRALSQLIETVRANTVRVPSHIHKLLVPLAYGYSDNRERFDGRTGLIPDPVSMAASASGFSLNLMFNAERLNRLSQQHAINNEVPSPEAIVNTLFNTLLDDAKAQPDDPVNQRILITAADTLVDAMQNEALAPEVRLALRQATTTVANKLNGHVVTEALAEQLKRYLSDGEWPEGYAPAALPPGSPI
ncbi:uncharacterized protein DUF5117 [Idiomarina fontislapidosi]|uniref:Peptidase n=1 Tax=Idiomarina fontislapidosi TaxID=263723 RepID=A0A432YB41_9GAMM|nr:zinc-dependent metalloprotease [Idiomarina fontislapidosi]PYE35262.1 uncharacterized protein DUF5117 [Idiomarina fontislapidosi]RUO58153.1 peptidase [Idiomarina fontislapidosi]